METVLVPLLLHMTRQVIPSQRDIVSLISLPDAVRLAPQLAVVPLKLRTGLAPDTRMGSAKAVAEKTVKRTKVNRIAIIFFIKNPSSLLI